MLRITLAINAETIADYEVRNVGSSYPADPDLCNYEVRSITDGQVGPLLQTIEHRRRPAGAVGLAAKVLVHLAAEIGRS